MLSTVIFAALSFSLCRCFNIVCSAEAFSIKYGVIPLVFVTRDTNFISSQTLAVWRYGNDHVLAGNPGDTRNKRLDFEVFSIYS